MGILDDIISFLGSVGSEILAILEYLFKLIVIVFQFLISLLKGVFNFFGVTTGDTYSSLGFMQDGFFRGVFAAVLAGIVKFGRFLASIIGPIVRWLKEASKWIDRIYNHYVRPILRILRIARVFLNLLKQLGVKWAAKLDSILGTIQNDIQRAFLTVKQYLNVMIDLLNILADPSNLLRRPTTLLSLRRIWHAFIRQYTGLPPGFFFPSPAKGVAPGLGFLGPGFDPNNPIQNPPASYYLAFDAGVPSFDFLGPGDTISDGAIDDVGTEDFFNSEVYPDPDCLDVATCRDQYVSQAQGALSSG